jgi:hypothetical protein
MHRLLTAMFGTLLATAPAFAQAPPDAAAAQPVAIDPSALGVSMSRISERLAADSRARSDGTAPLKLDFFVDVYGTAPALRFFTGQDLVYGSIPGSAPTHSDMLYQMTPQLFRQPVVNFFGLASGVARAATKKIDDWQYARELKRYQDWVEAGRNVPAPQPPRK